MRPMPSPRARGLRALLVGLLAAAGLSAVATPVRADPTPDSNEVAAAKQAVAQAQATADQAATLLAADQAQLAAAQDRLASQQQRLVTLNTEEARDRGDVVELQRQIRHDRAQLASFVRTAYEATGNETAVSYVLNAKDIGEVVQRTVQVGHITDAGNRLVDRIAAAEAQATAVLARATTARELAQAVQAQLATDAVLIANAATRAQQDADAAATIASQARRQLSQAEQLAAQRAAAAAELLAAARRNGTIFQPIPGPVFTVDTDLTQPSGETAHSLDSFLAGSALANLGGSYVAAEQTYHVSARYLVAHSIEESAFGTSAIARDKHNLFGYGANDANPYGNAMVFVSFDACIQFVAQKVSQDYLTVGGSFFHGPTLRGMNVSYASDPNWASKIAAIARTVPVPAPPA